MKHYITILLIATMLSTSIAYSCEDNGMSAGDVIVHAVDQNGNGAISAVELAAALDSPALTDNEKNFVADASTNSPIKSMGSSCDAVAPSCWHYGDIDDDGLVTKGDALYVARYTIFGESQYPMTVDQKRRADVNNNGFLDIGDASAIWNYAEGYINTFPICSLTDQRQMNWSTAGTYTVSVSAYNATTGQSEEVMWAITVIGDAPVITDWWNSKTQDNSTELTINVSEVVEFGATADQAIDSWYWT